MRVVFMGTPEFAVPSLEALQGATQVAGVYTRPDAVSGRGGTTRPCPVKVAAQRLGLPVFQPRSLRDVSALEALASLTPDLLVVAAYGLILPPAVLQLPVHGAINVHASLLPRWRGAAPVQRAILAGDTEIGVSIMRMEEGLDTGPYCLQEAMPVDQASALELTDRLARIGAETLLRALPSIVDGSVRWKHQDETLVTYADKVSKADVALSPSLSVEQAWRRVRASMPAAPCRISVGARHVTVVAARPGEEHPPDAPPPGSAAITKRGVLLGLADGALAVERLKPDGRREMAAADWARGTHDVDGAAWEALK